MHRQCLTRFGIRNRVREINRQLWDSNRFLTALHLNEFVSIRISSNSFSIQCNAICIHIKCIRFRLFLFCYHTHAIWTQIILHFTLKNCEYGNNASSANANNNCNQCKDMDLFLAFDKKAKRKMKERKKEENKSANHLRSRLNQSCNKFIGVCKRYGIMMRKLNCLFVIQYIR